MNNVIEPNIPAWRNDGGRFFVIACRENIADGGWIIDVIDFYDAAMTEADIYREIAENLVPISGGMINNAEKMDPTEQGDRIVSLSISSDNTCDLVGKGIDTNERIEWLSGIFDKLINQLREQVNTSS